MGILARCELCGRSLGAFASGERIPPLCPRCECGQRRAAAFSLSLLAAFGAALLLYLILTGG